MLVTGGAALSELGSRLATSGGRAETAARAARTDRGVTDARGIGVRLSGARSEAGGSDPERDGGAASGELGLLELERVVALGVEVAGIAELDCDGAAERDGSADRDGSIGEGPESGLIVSESSVSRSSSPRADDGTGSEPWRPSFRISEGTTGSLGITGEISGLVPPVSASPAHSESISAVSGALEIARDGRLEASSNEGRDGTGEDRSPRPPLAGAEDVMVGAEPGPEGTAGDDGLVPAAGLDGDRAGSGMDAGEGSGVFDDPAEVPLLADPSFLPRGRCALIALRETIWPVFPKKASRLIGRNEGKLAEQFPTAGRQAS